MDRKNQCGEHRIVPSRSAPLLLYFPEHRRPPGLPTGLPAGQLLIPRVLEAALTVRSELKFQEFVAELALVTHVVTKIKVTLHGSQKVIETKLEFQTAPPP